MSDLSTILQNSNDMEKKWTTYVAFPYSRAYASALSNFKATKGAQDKLNAKKAELSVLALTICSGGVLTHVFAQTAWKAVAANKALDIIANKNMEKAFNVAHFVSTNKVANFVVGGLWDAGAKFVDTKTKKLFEETPANFPSVQKWKTETDALTSLMGFVNECYLKYRDTARNVFGNSKLNEKERNLAVGKLVGSNFANPPSSSPINETQVTQEIELLLYLQHVLDLDYSQKISGYVAGGYGGKGQFGEKKDIKAMPDSKHYPKPYSKVHKSPGGRSGYVESLNVGYNELGKAFYDKINDLHKKLFGKNLLKTEKWADYSSVAIDQKSFLACYQTIKTLESRGLTRFKKTLATGLSSKAAPGK